MRKFNHIAIVTGAAGRIGAATVMRLVKSGVTPVLIDLQSCEETIKCASLKENEFLSFQGDIRDESFVQHIVDETVQKFRKIHILVNNAGTVSRESLEQLTEELWDRDLDTNIKTAYFFTKSVIHPHMLNQGYGRIINISSVSGINGGIISNIEGEDWGRSSAAYAASKGAVIAFTNWIAKEYGRYGITCNSVAPGATETTMTSDTEYDLSQQVIKRIGKPGDIAEAVAYFASPNSGYTTGQTLKVDGGVHIG